MHLVVRNAFGDYRRGDRIEGDAEIAAALEHHEHDVTRVNEERHPPGSVPAQTKS